MSYSKETICRTCLNEAESLYSLYDQYVDENGLQSMLITMLKKVCGDAIAFDLEDAKVCPSCLQKIFLSYEFILKVEHVEQNLLNRNEDEELELKSSKYEDDSIDIDSALDEKEIDACVDDEEQADFEYLEEEFETEPNDDECFVKNEAENNEDFNVKSELKDCDKGNIASFEVDDVLQSHNDTEHPIAAETLDISDLITFPKVKEPKIGSRINKVSTTRKLNCKKCTRTFAKAETLYKHIRKAHTYINLQTNETSSTDQRVLQCSYCPRIYKRNENLNRHLISAHADSVNVAEIKKKMSNKMQTYKRGLCPHCGESFSQASLIIHIRRHTGEYPYKCQECGKGFPRRQDLTIHVRQHTGEKPHVCNVCGKSFIRPNKLTRHMRIHTGDRPYACDRCNKRFVQSNDLKIHLRRHTGEKPYKCGVCGLGFICGALLKAHRNATSHHSPTDNLVDPYATCRVINRTNVPLEAIETVKC